MASKKALGRGLHNESLLVELKAEESRQLFATWHRMYVHMWGVQSGRRARHHLFNRA
jgi:hypothetical protein